MRTGRMTGLTLQMMRLWRWKGLSERFGPQRGELAARLGNSSLQCLVFCVLRSVGKCRDEVNGFFDLNKPEI